VRPAVEAPREPLRLLAHDGEEELARHFRLLRAEALDVDLQNATD
jgi:hypothetical protein